MGAQNMQYPCAMLFQVIDHKVNEDSDEQTSSKCPRKMPGHARWLHLGRDLRHGMVAEES